MSEKLWRKNFIDIEPYVAGEQSKNPDIIKLNANENPYPPSPKVQEILSEFNSGMLRKYPSADASQLKIALAELQGVNPENVFVGNGTDDVLATAFRGFFNSELPIVYPDITYSFYPVWCNLLKIPCKTIPVDDNFKINVKDYYAPNGGVVIPNPNAPTAIGEGEDFIIDLLEHNQDCVVIIDEAYADFSGYSCVELIKKYENLLVTHTFSKSRSMAGMRIGVAYGSAELIQVLYAVKDSYNSYPLDSVAIETGIASVKDNDYFLKTVSKVSETRDKAMEKFREMGFSVTDSKANFIFVSHEKYSAKEIFEYLKSKDIFIRYFNKPRIDNWLRITIGTEEEMDALYREVEKFLTSK
ncbi:MAG: histidinol-phosphate transaminase [Hominimerdicola sp.]